MLLALLPLALATTGFDPASPAERFTGEETWTQDGAVRLWSAIERLEDPDRALFSQEEFNSGTTWPTTSEVAPWIDDCFRSRTPHSASALLHMGTYEEGATGTPILMVHGAGDNGSRSFVTLGTRLNDTGRPVYAVTFAHPHGDVFQQAEQIANAVARIRARTGAAQVDLVAHSKGGIAAAVYLAHGDDAEWGDTPTAAAYEAVGTAYRGDVRRAVFVATPLGGIDSSYRWTNNNYVSLDADTAISPASWQTYYPYGVAVPAFNEDLTAQDLLSGGAGDLFPGHRQLLRRQSHALPGAQPWLENYAYQQDWVTTYEGGYGFFSFSEGIDAAIVDGGDLITKLETRGVDPGVALFVLAGSSPLMPNGDQEWLDELFGEAWGWVLDASRADAAELAQALVDEGVISDSLTESDLDGLLSGALVLGDVSGPSDGLVFVDSASHTGALTARGASLVEARVVNLSHMDLLYASPVTGELLQEAAAADPEGWGWAEGLAQRYIDSDTLGWIEEALADAPDTTEPGDTGETGGDDTGDDIGDTDADDTEAGEDTDGGSDGGADTDGATADGGTGAGGGKGCGCSGVASGGAAPVGLSWLGLMGLVALRRRR